MFVTVSNEDCPAVGPSFKELLLKKDPGDVGLGSGVDQVTQRTTSWDPEVFDLLNEFGIGFRSPFRVAELHLFKLCNRRNLRDDHPTDAILRHVELSPLREDPRKK